MVREVKEKSCLQRNTDFQTAFCIAAALSEKRLKHLPLSFWKRKLPHVLIGKGSSPWCCCPCVNTAHPASPGTSIRWEIQACKRDRCRPHGNCLFHRLGLGQVLYWGPPQRQPWSVSSPAYRRLHAYARHEPLSPCFNREDCKPQERGR